MILVLLDSHYWPRYIVVSFILCHALGERIHVILIVWLSSTLTLGRDVLYTLGVFMYQLLS